MRIRQTCVRGVRCRQQLAVLRVEHLVAHIYLGVTIAVEVCKAHIHGIFVRTRSIGLVRNPKGRVGCRRRDVISPQPVVITRHHNQPYAVGGTHQPVSGRIILRHRRFQCQCRFQLLGYPVVHQQFRAHIPDIPVVCVVRLPCKREAEDVRMTVAVKVTHQRSVQVGHDG